MEGRFFMVVQARYRKKFKFNTFPNRSQIFKLDKNFEVQSTCGDHRAMASSPSGPPITIRTPKNVTRVQESVSQSLSRSL